jgi:hypothetical protein
MLLSAWAWQIWSDRQGKPRASTHCSFFNKWPNGLGITNIQSNSDNVYGVANHTEGRQRLCYYLMLFSRVMKPDSCHHYSQFTKPWRPLSRQGLLYVFGFKPRPVHMGLVVDKVPLGQVFLEYSDFPMSSLFQQWYTFVHHDLSNW